MVQPARAYLDYNASAPIRAAAKARVLEALEVTSNPSSLHYAGRMGRKFIEDARREIGSIFDVDAAQIIFTSSATEANNTILKGFHGRRILVSATDHLSVTASGASGIAFIPVDEEGLVNLKALDELLRSGDVGLVSVMMVNNETGIVQPVAEIANMAHKYGALFHSDCVQAVGRIPFTRASIEADFITISAHKLGGALGAGAIIFKARTPVPKLIEGGGQEKRQRAGTENFAAIYAFGAACAEAANGINEFQKLNNFRERIELKLTADGYKIFGSNAPRVANTICFAHGMKDSQILLMGFDLDGVALSSGSACSSGAVTPSHVLKAMGASDSAMRSALRLSMGYKTTDEDVDLFLKIWDKLRV